MQRFKGETTAQFEARRAQIAATPAFKQVAKAVKELKKVIKDELPEPANATVTTAAVLDAEPPADVEPTKAAPKGRGKVKEEV